MVILPLDDHHAARKVRLRRRDDRERVAELRLAVVIHVPGIPQVKTRGSVVRESWIRPRSEVIVHVVHSLSRLQQCKDGSRFGEGMQGELWGIRTLALTLFGLETNSVRGESARNPRRPPCVLGARTRVRILGWLRVSSPRLMVILPVLVRASRETPHPELDSVVAELMRAAHQRGMIALLAQLEREAKESPPSVVARGASAVSPERD
jgi:hypothetical protein